GYSLEKMILKNYAEVESVRIHAEGLHTLAVTAKERELSAVVCAKYPDFAEKELSDDDPDACYFADASGYVFKKAPAFSGDLYNRYYIPGLLEVAAASSVESIVGLHATTTEEFVFLQKIYDGLKKNGITVDAMLMKTAGEYELYGRNPVIKTVQPASAQISTVVIYFNSAIAPEEQISNLLTVWNHLVENARTNKEKLEFEYIDVRYGKNVFYKLIK
ncbi:MAG: hypothetical protein M3Q80_02895, partial [bacterium]|nr:hypothetical protein [bacterium]